MRSSVLDPQIRDIIKLVAKTGYPPYWALTPEQARAQFEKTAPVLDVRPVRLQRIENRNLPGPGGDIPVRVYWLRAAGNRVELIDYPGMVHAFYSMGGAVDCARDALQRSARTLRRAFDTL